MRGVLNRLIVQAQQNIARLYARLGGNPWPDLLHPHPALISIALTGGQIRHHDIQSWRTVVRGMVQRQFIPVPVRQLTERNCNFLRLAVADHGQRPVHAGLGRAHQRRQIGAVVHRLAGISDDDVTGFQSRLGRRAIGADFRHQSAAWLLQIEGAGQILRHLLQAHAHPAPADATIGFELRHHIHSHIHRNSER